MDKVLALMAVVAQAQTTPTPTRQRKIHLQLVHVQDATDSFADDFVQMKNNHFVQNLLTSLNQMYKKVEYAYGSFQDKPLPVVGYSKGNGWWDSKRFDNYFADTSHCYLQYSPLSEDHKNGIEAFQKTKMGGGKDFGENQWDALRRPAMDEKMGWKDEKCVGENQVVKVVLLVTDDVAHTAKETFQYFPRNLSREEHKKGGPYQDPVPYQQCEYDNEKEKENNIIDQYNSDSGRSDSKCFGWALPRTGTRRSLKGLMSYYNYIYNYGDDDEMVSSVECMWDLTGECQKYHHFLTCCTVWGHNFRHGWCDNNTEAHNSFPRLEECQNYGGKYGVCHPDETDCPVKSDSRSKNEPSKAFNQGKLNDVADFRAYPYSSTDLDELERDCAQFEYPNPRAFDDYFGIFVDKDIVPIVVASPPTGSVFTDVNPNVKSLGSYDADALRLSAESCPGLKMDPWTIYACSRDPVHCKNPHSFKSGFVDMYSRSVDEVDDGDSWWTSPCTSTSCQTAWLNECMENEYGQILHEASKHFETKKESDELITVYHALAPKHRHESIIEAIKTAVTEAVGKKEKTNPCLASSTKPVTTTRSVSTSSSRTCSNKKGPCSCNTSMKNSLDKQTQVLHAINKQYQGLI